MRMINNKEYEPSGDDLQQLREWLKKMPHIIQDYDDEFLASFVRGCKGSLQKTKSVLENFSSIGMRYENLFGSLDPLNERTRNYLNYARIFPLPRRAPDGSIIIMVTVNKEHGDLNKLYSLELYRHLLMWFYIFIWENNYGEGKWMAVLDFGNLTLHHIWDTTPLALKQLIDVLQNAVPVRVQAAHVINVPPFMGWIVNLVKTVMSKKLGDRIHFHSNSGNFYKDIPKEYLPKEYGGCEESLYVLHDRWKKREESYRERFVEEQNKMRSLDALRPKSNEIQEMDGTFKMLNID